MNYRSGNALILTMGVIILVVSMLGVASTRLKSMHSLAKIDLAKQQAISAAEAIASIKEARLVEIAASNDLSRLAQNPDTKSSTEVWEGAEWFGNCLVRWRAEPVVVADGRKETDGLRKWTANPFLSTPNLSTATAMAALPGEFIENYELYHFRIVAEAHYLADKNLLDDSTRSVQTLADENKLPWQPMNASMSTGVARATRIIQMRINSLFKYALFYAQENPNGDMEIGPGYSQSIVGKVHSNAGIYIAGGGMKSGSFSAPSGWGPAYIGTAVNPVSLTGINGVFCTRKDTFLNARLSNNGDTLQVMASTDPLLPQTAIYNKVRFGDGTLDPQPGMSRDGGVSGWFTAGGIPTNYYAKVESNFTDRQNNHFLNGKRILYTADSRNGDAMRLEHDGYMRDSFNSGSTVVKTLSNIPELGGRPFEAQALFADDTQIWTLNPALLTNIAYWTVLPNNPPAPYYAGPDLITPSILLTSSAKYSFVNNPGVDGLLVTQVAHKLYFTTDPWSLQTYLQGDSYSAGSPDLSAFIDIEDPANPGQFLNNPGLDFDNKWMVDAGGLRKYYQRTTGAGPSARDGLYTIDGIADSDEARSIEDIFDPDGTYSHNPDINGDDTMASFIRMPGDATFRYNGPAVRTHPDAIKSVSDAKGGFSINEVPGPYYRWALRGQDSGDDAGKVALVIRERPYQMIPNPSDLPHTWTGMPGMPVGAGGGSSSSSSSGSSDFPQVRVIDDDNRRAYIDAIRFVKVSGSGPATFIIDAGTTSIPASSADWENSTNSSPNDSRSGYNSERNRYTRSFRSGSGAVYLYSVLSALEGTYRIDVKHPRASAGSTSVTYRVTGLDGSGAPIDTSVNLSHNGNSNFGWYSSLGTWTFGVAPTPSPGGGTGTAPTDFAGQYANYLRSQYVVYYGMDDMGTVDPTDDVPHDITDLFFNYGADPVSTVADSDMICHERQLLDRRDMVFMQYNFWDQDLASFENSSTYYRKYRNNVLTLNMNKVLEFMSTIRQDEIESGVRDLASTAVLASDNFNGMIFVARQRRGDGFTPWATNRWSNKCYLLWHQTGVADTYRQPRDVENNLQTPLWWDANLNSNTTTDYDTVIDNYNTGTVDKHTAGDHTFDWRCASGPAMIFHSSVRFANGSDLSYGVDYLDDMGTADVSDDYRTKKGLTIVTPNKSYVWGDYNTLKYADSNATAAYGDTITYTDDKYFDILNALNQPTPYPGSTNNNYDDNYKLPPAAIFADAVRILSNDFQDGSQRNTLRTNTTGHTFLFASMMVNNIASHRDGKSFAHSSEGTHNIIRYQESWGSNSTFHLKGSTVVMNVQRYGRGHIAYMNSPPNKNNDVYDPPNRDFKMNYDLFTKPGQPPFTPFGIQVIRTVSTIDMMDSTAR